MLASLNEGKVLMKIRKSSIIIFILLIISASLLLYPTVSNLWNSMHQTFAVGSYITKTEDLSEEQNQQLYQQAQEYNKKLVGQNLDRFIIDKDKEEEYDQLLQLEGTEIMSIVDIPKINLRLPIYHGTDEAVLQIAIGHIFGTSLPVGGEGTHTVISGHTGLTSSKLFTDIEKLEKGDVFTITTLGHEMTYQVDKITVVLPTELNDLAIDPKEDFVTLQTCTPYGVNTHRLLVRGHRIESGSTERQISSDAVEVSPLISNAIGISIILSFVGILRLNVWIFDKLLSNKHSRKL